MLKRNRKKKGQSTLEYIILVAALVSGLVVFLASDSSPFKKAVNQTYTSVLDGMENKATDMVDSW
ncbi:MAG: hypothetical protein P9M07_02095 [Candidatus Aceula meridiana]|nr:hypothetical protein [Candidatus Aceula meridiana]